ncbi:MAG: hypothetical protein P1U34_10775 [Coxiellaceae bacterium]|nr:hypothetical protein [Coxiellaceae bacterium]
MSFIEITVKNHQILHGFDAENKEIIEEVEVDVATKKLININRVLSVSPKFILTSYACDRIIYWEYLEDYEQIKKMINYE